MESPKENWLFDGNEVASFEDCLVSDIKGIQTLHKAIEELASGQRDSIDISALFNEAPWRSIVVTNDYPARNYKKQKTLKQRISDGIVVVVMILLFPVTWMIGVGCVAKVISLFFR